jgi:hypothetical protein
MSSYCETSKDFDDSSRIYRLLPFARSDKPRNRAIPKSYKSAIPMLRFFRQIRKKLMEQNKIRTYIFYAVGEIALVMIGILLALQVNNWNEVRITENQEYQLLLSLKEELGQNLIELQEVIRINNANIEGANEFASVLSPDVTKLPEEKISKLWDKTFKVDAIYRPSSGVLSEAINSGSLSIIQNRELKTALASWEARIEQLKVHEENVFLFRMAAYDHLREHGNFRKILDHSRDTETWYQLKNSAFSSSNKKLLRSSQFENDLLLFIGTSVYFEYKYLLPLEEYLKSSIELLNKEIADA